MGTEFTWTRWKLEQEEEMPFSPQTSAGSLQQPTELVRQGYSAPVVSHAPAQTGMSQLDSLLHFEKSFIALRAQRSQVNDLPDRVLYGDLHLPFFLSSRHSSSSWLPPGTSFFRSLPGNRLSLYQRWFQILLPLWAVSCSSFNYSELIYFSFGT